MLFFGLIIIAVLCQYESKHFDLEPRHRHYYASLLHKRDVPNIQVEDGLPSFAALFGKSSPDGSTSYEVLGCTIKNTKNGCLWTLIPDKTCLEKLSLGKIFEMLSSKSEKLKSLQNLTKSIFSPGAFVVKQLILTTCGDSKGNVQFSCQSVQPFDVIKDKVKIVSGELNLKFNYMELQNEFAFTNIELDIKGKVEIAGLIVSVQVQKDKKSSSSSIKIFAEEIKVTDFSKFFLKTKQEAVSEVIAGIEDSNGDIIVNDGGMFSKIFIEKPVIKIMRSEDGSYEIIINGKATGITGLGDINALLVIQKPTDGPVGVGIVASLKNVQPLKVISAIIGKDLNDIDILKDLLLDISIEYANIDILKLKDTEIKELLSASIPSHSATLSEGTIISLNIPINKILKNIGSPANLKNIPKELSFQIIIKSEKISFVFPPDIFEDGMNILAALAPNAFDLLNKYLFKSKFKILFKKYDVNIKTKVVEISISIPDEIALGNTFISVKNAEFELKLDENAKFRFLLKAELQLAGSSIKIEVEKKDEKFELKGSIALLTSTELINAFGSKELDDNLKSKMSNFNFGIKDLQLTAQFGQGVSQEVRLVGVPILFNWEGMKFEAYMLSKQVPLDQLTKFSENTIASASQFNNQSNKYEINPYFFKIKIAKRNRILSKETDDEDTDYDDTTDGVESSVQRSFDIDSEPVTQSVSSTKIKSDDASKRMMSEKQMGLAIFMKDIRIDSIFENLFNKTIMGTNWMVNLNIALVISSTDKNLFTIPEVKNAVKTVNKGIYFRGTLTLPQDCMKNELCEFAKKRMSPNAVLFVTASFQDSTFFLKAGYEGTLELSKLAVINSLNFEVKVGLKNEFSLSGKLTLQLKPNPLVFEVSIKLDVSGGLKLEGTMNGIWHNPFNLPNFAFGNVGISVTLQVPVFAFRGFELSGEVRLGIPGKEIIAKAAGGTDMATDNYLYADINKLSISGCSDAFGYNLKLPQVILDSGFPDGVTIGFSSKPKGKEVKQLGTKIENGFQLQGMLNVLGFKAKSKVVINPKKLLVDCELSRIDILNGALVLARTLKDQENGPKVFIELSPTSAKFFIQGAISILGISSAVTIDIGDNGIHFSISGNLFGIVEANLTVKAPYGKNMKLSDAGFQVAACLSADLNEATNEANTVVQDAVEQTKEIVSVTQTNVNERATWYNKIISRMESFKKTMEKLLEKMTITATKIKKYEQKIETDCTEKCNNVGKFYANKKCLAKCVMAKKYASIKIVAKKAKQEIREVRYKLVMSILNAAEALVKKSKTIIDKTEAISNSVSSYAQAGLKAVKDVSEYLKKNIIQIHHACFDTSLELASKACFGVKLNVTVMGNQNKVFDTETCFEMGFMKSIGKAITDKIYPGIRATGEKIKETKAKLFQVDEDEKE
ncbi:uncharacterized protein LOC101237303 isoform X3 [Hydra vulgaris]